MAGFPIVIRATDCTHIAIKTPSHNKLNDVNRKEFNSINVEIICDAHLALLVPVGLVDCMTPLANSRPQQKQTYNQAQTHSRSTVERAVGLLKG